jgi:hypothetical protein
LIATERARNGRFEPIGIIALVGVGLVGEAVVRTVLALTISTETFLVVAQIINWSVLGGLLWFSVASARAGERRVTALLELPPS